MKAKIPDLPKSEDEYWDGAETQLNTPKKIGLCDTHFKNWEKHNGYIDNKDGTFSCKLCGWGASLPGYYKVYKDKLVDLRKL